MNFEQPIQTEEKDKEIFSENNKNKRLLRMAVMLTMLLGSEALGAELKNYRETQKEISKIETMVKSDPDKVFNLSINGISAGKEYIKSFEKNGVKYNISFECRGLFIEKNNIDEDGNIGNTRLFFDKNDIKTGKPDGKIDCMIIIDGETKSGQDQLAKMELTSTEKELETYAELEGVIPENKKSPYDNRVVAKINHTNKTIFLANMKMGGSGVIEDSEEYKKLNNKIQSSYSSSVNDISDIIENNK